MSCLTDHRAEKLLMFGDISTAILMVTVIFYYQLVDMTEIDPSPVKSVLLMVQPIALFLLLLVRIVLRKYSRSEKRISLFLSGLGWTGLAYSFIATHAHVLTQHQITTYLFVNLLSEFVLCLDLSIMVRCMMKSTDGQTKDACETRLLHPALYFLVFLIVLVPLGFVHGISRHLTGDEPHYLMMTHSLLHDRDLNLFNNYEEEDFRFFYPGELTPQPADVLGKSMIRSYHSPFLSILLLPGYAVAGKMGAILTMVLMAALLMAFLADFIDRVSPEDRVGCVVSMMLVWTLPFSQYSFQLFTEVPAAIFSFLALRMILLSPYSPYRTGFLTIIYVLCLVILKLRYLPLALGLLILASVTSPHRSRRVWFRPLAILSGVVTFFLISLLAALDLPFVSRFSHFFRDYHRILTRWDAGSFSAAFGLLFDQEYGFLFHAPFVLLIMIAAFIVKSERRKIIEDCQWVGLLICIILPLFAIIKHKSLTWHGGWAPPLRFLVSVVPIIMPFATLLRHVRSPTFKACLWFGLLFSIIISIGMLVHPELAYNYLDGSANWLVLAGHLLDRDLVSLFPSSIRPNCALLPWLVICSIFLFIVSYEHRRSPDFQNLTSSRCWLDGRTIVRFIILCMLVAAVFGLSPMFPTLVLEAEDIYQFDNQPGEFFPVDSLAEHKRTPLFRCGLQLSMNGSIIFPIRTWAHENILRLWAKGTPSSNEWPMVEVWFDERLIGRTRVVSDQFRTSTHEYKRGAKRHGGEHTDITMQWMAFDFLLHGSSGPHKIKVSFINDHYDRETRQDRNLIIDRIELLPKISVPFIRSFYLSCMPYSMYGIYS